MTSEVRPQTSHYLEKKAMCEQIEGLPKSVKNVGWREQGSETEHVQDTCLSGGEDHHGGSSKRVHMEAFGSTQEDDGQRLGAGAQGEAIEDFRKRAQLHSSVAWRVAAACDELDVAEKC